MKRLIPIALTVLIVVFFIFAIARAADYERASGQIVRESK